jgi:hypothetical protein
MPVLARLRRVLARRPWLYWAAVLLLAVAVGTVIASMAASVDAARRAWGDTRPVLVATVALAPGDALAGATEVREHPGPMTPEAALDAAPEGAVARQHIAVGEVLVAADVAPTAAPQSLIPAGWSAVAVTEPVPTGAMVGDRVGAVAAGVVLTSDGLVVGRATDAVLVAVPDDAAPAVAMAASSGTLALLLQP